ncbi:MAG: hypothetical protein PSV36_00165 [Algoriphagus sp.]|nr:hypothetical protein [Algoriphagus sp.]
MFLAGHLPAESFSYHNYSCGMAGGLPQQRGWAGIVQGKLCCGLNFWFFWFKPKEHKKEKSIY